MSLLVGNEPKNMNHDKDNQLRYTNWALHAVGSLAVALVLTAFYQLGYAKLVEQGEAYDNRSDQLEKLLATSDAVRRKHQLLRQELDDLRQEAATMHRRLPHELQKDLFEDSLLSAALKVGIRLENPDWSTPKHTPTHSLAEVSVEGIGSFASVCQFLSEINQLARITKISHLQLRSNPESEAYPFEVTFVLVYGIESNDTDKKEEVL